MTINSNQIRESIYYSFKKQCPSNADFINSGELWDMSMSAINDVWFINTMIFCNDIHQIPPIITLLKALKPDCAFSDTDKQNLNVLWEYIFKSIFGYKTSEAIDSCAYYSNANEKVTVT